VSTADAGSTHRDVRDEVGAREALSRYALRLGDDALVLSQRLGEWIARAPQLEEDVAVGNIALDLLGQARSLLTHAGRLEGQGTGDIRDEDALAYLRDVLDYRNLLLVERPNGDFAHTIARQFLFDAFNVELMAALAGSRDARLAAIAAKAAKEAAYHVRHSAEWAIRLGDGTAESHARMRDALDALWPYTGEMFTADEVDAALAAAGIGIDLGALRPGWDRRVDEVLREATLARPGDGWMQPGGGRGRHGEHLGYLLAEMQFLQRAYPGATW
jgi:ring-1,2-phenylacetyl-CoA epoxidase subunit PaaC